MTRPTYRLERHVPAPPDAVLAAIRDAVARTERRRIPPGLQRGVRGLRGKARGPRFTVSLDHTEGGDTELVGTVVGADGGGSEVRASVLDSRHAPVEALVLLGIATILAVTGNGGAAWMMAGFAALVAIITTFRRATGRMDHAEAAFLLEWLDGVLDPPASADPGATLDPVGRVSSPA